MNTISDLSAAHALLGAELTLRWCGWHQGDFEGPRGRVCAEGALRFAITGSAEPDGPPMTHDEVVLFLESQDYLKTAADTDWLPNWNDQRGRTVEQVLAVFAQARRLAGGAS